MQSVWSVSGGSELDSDCGRGSSLCYADESWRCYDVRAHKTAEVNMTFLTKATSTTLQRAAADNHIAWMVDAAMSSGGSFREEDGVTWVHTPHKAQAEITFPVLPRDTAARTIDLILRSCRRLSLRRLACWSLWPSRPPELGAILVARGFTWNWKPRWMWLDLCNLKTDHGSPAGLDVGLVEDDEPTWEVDDLPYYDPVEAKGWTWLHRATPRRSWQFVARIDGQVVGHTKLNVTTGPLGVAGIYNVGVRPAFRGRGIAKAVIGEALQQALRLGCRHALLNGTGERVYRQLGFELLGYGQTWVCKEALTGRRVPQRRRLFIEAIGRADIPEMERLCHGQSSAAVNRALPGGMTPMQLAVEMGQPRVVRWFVDRLAS